MFIAGVHQKSTSTVHLATNICNISLSVTRVISPKGAKTFILFDLLNHCGVAVNKSSGDAQILL